MSIDDYIQDNIKQVDPYKPGMPITQLAREYGMQESDIIKLASNENPLGPSPKALNALDRSLADSNRYPDQYDLIDTLAKRYDVKQGNIIVGNGSNDVLDLIARVFLGAGVEAVSSEYGFFVYGLLTQLSGGTNVIANAEKYGHNLDNMYRKINDRTKIIWIANPNNPTGTFIPYADIHAFLLKIPSSCFVVLDEAYFEYLKEEEQYNSIAWVSEFPNLIITRTFSKIYGLAGFRIGYGIGHESVIEVLNRARQPFNVSNIALGAACAALEDTEHITRSKELNKQGLLYLEAQLKKLGLTYLPSYGNFVTIKFLDSSYVYKSLLTHGIITRPLNNYGMTDFLRVTVGTKEENEKFINTLSGVLKRQ